MLAPFLIMLREGIEAALITSIVASYLRQTDRSAWMPALWVGVFLALAISLFLGAGLQLISAEFPQKAQELFEAIVGMIAVVVLVYMVFWMRKASRSIKAELHDSIDSALASSSGQAFALTAIVFFAVAREGIESIFFLLAIFQQSSGPAAPLGALAGLLCAVAIGYALYVGGMRLDLRRFFRWTSVVILIVAAGILSSVLRNLHEAGIWNSLQSRPYDLGEVLPVSGLLGAILSGLFNYEEAPTIGQIIIYVVFLAVTLPLFLRPIDATPRLAPATADGSRGNSHG
jgi:high-affinity iron transporter